jgi:hypothetical protein
MTMSLHDDRAYFANLADQYEREAAMLDGGQIQQSGTEPPPPPPASNDHAAPAQQQQQPQPDKKEE